MTDWRNAFLNSLVAQQQPVNRLAQFTAGRGYDDTYDQAAADQHRQFGFQQRAYPLPDYAPSYAFQDRAFVMPPNQAARNLGFDAMDLADRQYYQDRVLAPPKLPRFPGR